MINNETKLTKEEITEEKLKTLIDNISWKGKIILNTPEETMEKEQDNEYINTDLNLPFAYSLGLFAGFSPCLMAILGFLLSFTAGTSNSAKSGMVRATNGIWIGTGRLLHSFRFVFALIPKINSRSGKLFFCYRHHCNSYWVKSSGDLKIACRSG